MTTQRTTDSIQADEQLAYSVSDLVRVLSISRPTAYQLVHQDGFPVVRVGNRILVPKQGLEDWLAEQSEVQHGA